MIVIYNRFIPFGHFHGMNLFGIIFVQRKWGKMSRVGLNHELIHTRQQVEMAFIFFYIWYLVEHVIRLFQYHFDANKAYRNISFEREAYANEKDLDYLHHRRWMAWFHYLRIH